MVLGDGVERLATEVGVGNKTADMVVGCCPGFMIGISGNPHPDSILADSKCVSSAWLCVSQPKGGMVHQPKGGAQLSWMSVGAGSSTSCLADN